MLYRYTYITHNIHTVKAKFDKVILTGNLDVMLCSIWRKSVVQQHSNLLYTMKKGSISSKQAMKE